MLEYTFLASGTYIVIQVERKVPLTKKSNWVEIRAKSYATICHVLMMFEYTLYLHVNKLHKITAINNDYSNAIPAVINDEM